LTWEHQIEKQIIWIVPEPNTFRIIFGWHA
jgi:hypothetical protein